MRRWIVDGLSEISGLELDQECFRTCASFVNMDAGLHFHQKRIGILWVEMQPAFIYDVPFGEN